MLKSARKRNRKEAETDAALKNERTYRANGKSLNRKPSPALNGKKGATLGKLSQVWPSVNWSSALGR